MVRSQSSKPSVRDRILTTASVLFYQEGTQSVGIDRIIAESGVAKMSLYNHFKSKDALIAAWLVQQSDTWHAWLSAAVERLAPEPKDRLLAVFDALTEWFEQPDFRGCAFVNTSIGLANSAHPGHAVITAHRQKIADYVIHLAYQVEPPNPELLAQQIMLLIEGAVVMAAMQKDTGTAVRAKQIARVLMSESVADSS